MGSTWACRVSAKNIRSDINEIASGVLRGWIENPGKGYAGWASWNISASSSVGLQDLKGKGET